MELNNTLVINISHYIHKIVSVRAQHDTTHGADLIRSVQLGFSRCWMPYNQWVAKSLGFTPMSSRPKGFSSSVIVVCDHCWALPL